MHWKTLKGCGLVLSQPFPMLLNWGLSPHPLTQGLPETTHTAAAHGRSLPKLPPSWGVHFWAVVNKQAPRPYNLGSDPGSLKHG